jgi:hypothetical protein
MKIMSLFLCLLCFAILLYPASAADGRSLDVSEVKKISDELTVISQQCSRFQLDTIGMPRSEQMEAAGSLVDRALLLHKRSVVGLIHVGATYLQRGVDLNNVSDVLPHLKDAQDNEKFTRKAVVYSSQKLIDTINKESRFYAAPPSEKDLQDHIFQLKSRRKSEISAPYVEKIFSVGKHLGLDHKIFQEDLLSNSADFDIEVVSDKSSSCCQIQ